MGLNTAEPQSADDLFDCALDLMRSGKYAPALRCLLQLSRGELPAWGPGFLAVSNPSPASRMPEPAAEPARRGSPPVEAPALFYNLALCYIKAEDFQSALKELENSLKLVKKAGTPPSRSAAPQMEPYKKLRAREAGELSPMPKNYPLLLTGEAEEDIVMALASVYKKCGRGDQARTMAASLKGEEFAVFRKEYGAG